LSRQNTEGVFSLALACKFFGGFALNQCESAGDDLALNRLALQWRLTGDPTGSIAWFNPQTSKTLP